MVREFKLPDVGEGVAEGEIVAWLVEVGDPVEEDQPVAEVETDKALVEVPSPVTGTVRELRAEPGDVVPVGDVFITFDVAGEEPPAARQAEPDDVAGEEADDAGDEAGAAEEAPEGAGEAGEAPAAGEEAAEAQRYGARVFAAPSVRRLARELGVDLSTVEGSDPGGRVTAGDVRATAEGGREREAESADGAVDAAGHAGEATETTATGAAGGTAPAPGAGGGSASAAAAATARDRTLAAPATRRLAEELGVDIDAVPATEQRDGEAFVTADAVRAFAEAGGEAAATEAGGVPGAGPAVAAGEEERVPYRGLRRTIGKQMERSAYTAPHVTHHDLLDAKPLVEAREALKPLAEERGVRLTFLPFVVKAATAALAEYPSVNASLDEEAGEIVLKGYYNVGFATATDDGLLVPVIQNADQKDLFELAAEVTELAERARDRTIAREEMQGGTFTVTNFGAVGGDYGTPIINYPEVAILGLGAIEKRPYVVDDAVVARETMPLSLSFDHRVIDGATAGRFTNRLIEYLEQPLLLVVD